MQALKNDHRSKAGRGAFKLVFLVLAWLVIISLARDALKIEGGFERVSEVFSRLEREEAKNADLLARYDDVRTEEHKEKLIRELLNMQKEGEVIVVLPRSDVGEIQHNNRVDEDDSNWEKWLKLMQ